MCSCHSILECCVTFSGVKLSIRSFVLFFIIKKYEYHMAHRRFQSNVQQKTNEKVWK